MTGRSTTNDLIVIAGAGGFVGGSLVRYFHERGGRRIRAVDKKPVADWYQRVPQVETLCLDLSLEENCRRAVAGAAEVYNLAADMGGMGFIERFRIECLRNVLINTHQIEAACAAGVERYFFASSACVYNAALQNDPNVVALKEADAYPAMPERGYGWEKLMGEMFCQEYWAERGLKTAIARMHNVYGPHGSWDGGREKAPAAICRKVVDAVERNSGRIVIWGDGTATRSFTYIDDCVSGIDRITTAMRSSPRRSISDRGARRGRRPGIESRAHRRCEARARIRSQCSTRRRRPHSDNTFIKKMLDWSEHDLDAGLAATYRWIQTQYRARHPQRDAVQQASDKTADRKGLLGLHTQQQGWSDGGRAACRTERCTALRRAPTYSPSFNTFLLLSI
jgi:nucleoside-diphosphate-sugar epimerase